MKAPKRTKEEEDMEVEAEAEAEWAHGVACEDQILVCWNDETMAHRIEDSHLVIQDIIHFKQCD